MARRIQLAFLVLMLVLGFFWLREQSEKRPKRDPAPEKTPAAPVETPPPAPAPDVPWELVGTITEDGEPMTIEKRGDERRLLRSDGTTLELYTEIAEKREGTSTRWFQSGNVHSTGAWRAGKQEGTWMFFNDDGSIAQQGAFVSGAREGLWESWYPNGLLRWRGSYERGRQVGPWSFVKPTGEADTVQTGRYEDGKKVGN